MHANHAPAEYVVEYSTFEGEEDTGVYVTHYAEFDDAEEALSFQEWATEQPDMFLPLLYSMYPFFEHDEKPDDE